VRPRKDESNPETIGDEQMDHLHPDGGQQQDVDEPEHHLRQAEDADNGGRPPSP
jgi:hypothetical protein